MKCPECGKELRVWYATQWGCTCGYTTDDELCKNVLCERFNECNSDWVRTCDRQGMPCYVVTPNCFIPFLGMDTEQLIEEIQTKEVLDSSDSDGRTQEFMELQNTNGKELFRQAVRRAKRTGTRMIREE